MFLVDGFTLVNWSDEVMEETEEMDGEVVAGRRGAGFLLRRTALQGISEQGGGNCVDRS